MAGVLSMRPKLRRGHFMIRLAVLAVIFTAVSSVGLGSAARAEEIKLGYVDMQRAVAETEDGRKARAMLKKDFDQKQKELDEQQEELKKGMEDLEKKRTLLPADQVRSKEQELQSKLQKVQQTYMRHQQELQGKEQEALGKIVERMNRIVHKIASDENFTMVLDRTAAGLVFAKPHLDLTNDLIRRYNAGEAKEGGAPAKGAAAAPKPAPKK
jgi:outer membrane protein